MISRGIAKGMLLAINSQMLTREQAMEAYRIGIHTEHVKPPIPVNAFDWAAWFDDYDGAPDAPWQPVGSGKTEAEAVVDLLCSYTSQLLMS